MDRVKIIQAVTARHFGLTREQLLSGTRSIHVARPRQIAMYIARKITRKSYPYLAHRFGGLHHTSVMYSERRVDGFALSNARIRMDIETITARALDLFVLFEPTPALPAVFTESLAA